MPWPHTTHCGWRSYLKVGRVEALPPHVHEIVVQVRAARRHQFEGLVCTGGGDDGVGRCDRGDDVLDDALRVHERDARDVELLGALERMRIDPVLVLRIVLVRLGVRELARVLDQMGVQDAVRGAARRLGDGAERHGLLRREEVERALKARAHAGNDGAHVPREALGAAVHHRDHRLQIGLALAGRLVRLVLAPARRPSR